MTFQQKVWERCSRIPKGKVSTYKEIARALNTKAYRAVGNALRTNPFSKVPCHRVVRSDGTVGGYKGHKSSPEKKILLKKEGIIIKGNKITDFRKKLFTFSSS